LSNGAFYNEIDPKAAQWLRNLIEAGLIAPGIVDERPIEDIRPEELKSFTQCHFFAGIGVWSYALRQAQWPDDRPVWTGSCPCQPFSSAGKGEGFADERHLWPSFHWLIQECRPPVVFGEQVASKAIDPWVDLIQADLEALDYAFGAIPFPAAGVGAPHIRDRLYWVADHIGKRQPRQHPLLYGLESQWNQKDCFETSGGGEISRMADSERERIWACGSRATPVAAGALQGIDGQWERLWSDASPVHDDRGSGQPAAISTQGFWRDSDWLLCRDGRWRPVEPSTFPLAHGAPARVGRLRGYGNAICAEAAKVWVESYLDIEEDPCDERN